MHKIYDQLWDQNATMAMAALVQKGDIPNPWEVARKAYELADCMAEIREERIKTTPLPTMNDSPGVGWTGVGVSEVDVINLSGAQTITLGEKNV